MGTGLAGRCVRRVGGLTLPAVIAFRAPVQPEVWEDLVTLNAARAHDGGAHDDLLNDDGRDGPDVLATLSAYVQARDTRHAALAAKVARREHKLFARSRNEVHQLVRRWRKRQRVLAAAEQFGLPRRPDPDEEFSDEWEDALEDAVIDDVPVDAYCDDGASWANRMSPPSPSPSFRPRGPPAPPASRAWLPQLTPVRPPARPCTCGAFRLGPLAPRQRRAAVSGRPGAPRRAQH